MRLLLDTDTCIDLLRGRSPVVTRAARVAPDDCAVSTITVYELYTGAAKCKTPERETGKIETFVGTIHELPFSREAALRAGGIRAELEAGGRMIGPYDVLLAGQALAEGLCLVTSNSEEFGRIPGLTTNDWRS